MPMSSPSTPNASRPQSAALAAYLKNQPFQSKWNDYYSRVRVVATSGGAGASYVVAAGPELLAFGYGRGGDMTAAGLPGVQATPADTNITTANQTVSGEAVEVKGVGIILLGQSDAALAKAADQCISVKIKINGQTDYYLGIPSMTPGPGGLMGFSDSGAVFPSQLEQFGYVGAMSNGLPHCTNYCPLPEPMIWAPAGKGDSAWNIILKIERTITTPAYLAGAARSAVAGGTGTSGVAAYTPITFGNCFVDYMVVLVGRTINPLSSN